MIATFFLLAAVAALAALAYLYWARRTRADIAESAGQEWERLSARAPELVAGLSEDRFRAIFQRVHFPRFPKYALAIFAAFIIALPVTLALLAGLAFALDTIGLSADANVLAKSIPISGSIAGVSKDEGETIAIYYVQDFLKFFYYFGIIFAWLSIVFVAMRRYHRRRPGYLAEEILAEKAKG